MGNATRSEFKAQMDLGTLVSDRFYCSPQGSMIRLKMRVKNGGVNRQCFNAAVVIVVDHFPQKCNHQM